MELCGKRVSHRLGAMRRGALGIWRFRCVAVRDPLVRQCPRLTFARALLARSGLSGLICIVHNYKVPRVGTRNKPV